jgi:hypothetical protein
MPAPASPTRVEDHHVPHSHVAVTIAGMFVDFKKPPMASQKTGAAAVTVERPGMARKRFQ